jgi:glycerophosphoryl diester phosphodiesterase
MPNDYPNLGRVAPGYKAFAWFGRPLLLSSRTRTHEHSRLTKIIEAELARGCDGFVFRLSAKATDASFAQQLVAFEEALHSYSQAAFIYIEIIAEGSERPLLDIFKQHSFPKGYMFASRNPNVLLELYRLKPSPDANAAIIVDTEKGVSNIGRCPHTTVEILDALATHDRILEVHRSLKEVFVRALYQKDSSMDVREVEKIEKRVKWLAHEKVDAIISDRTDLLSSVLGVAQGHS